MTNWLIDLSAKHRLAVVMLSLAGALAGWWSLTRMPLDAIPDLGDTQVIVYSTWDRSPDIIEDQVTYPIVSALLGTPKVNARYRISRLLCTYSTTALISRAREPSNFSLSLPRLQGAPPRRERASTPLVDESGTHSLADLRSLQDWYLRYHLKSVHGVADVASVGGYRRQYQVNVDPNRLRAYGLSIGRVVDAVRGGNSEVGGRLIEYGGAEYMVRGRGYAKSIADFENIALAAGDTGTPVRIADMAGKALAGAAATRRQQRNRVQPRRECAGGHRARPREAERCRGRTAPRREGGAGLRSRRPDHTLRVEPQMDAGRDHDHGRRRHPALPLAHPERDDPGVHHPDRRVDRLHSVPGVRPQRQHHVAWRHCHRRRRTGRRLDCPRRTDAQAARVLGPDRSEGKPGVGNPQCLEAGRQRQLLLAARHRRRVSAGAHPRSRGGAAVQAATRRCAWSWPPSWPSRSIRRCAFS